MSYAINKIPFNKWLNYKFSNIYELYYFKIEIDNLYRNFFLKI